MKCSPIRDWLWNHTDPPPPALTLTGHAADYPGSTFTLVHSSQRCHLAHTGPNVLGPFPFLSLPSLTQQRKGDEPALCPSLEPREQQLLHSQNHFPSPAQPRGRCPHPCLALTHCTESVSHRCSREPAWPVCPWVHPLGTRNSSAPL